MERVDRSARGALPNVPRVALVVGWFGTDLRIGECELRPGVETASKTTEPYRVVGLRRHPRRRPMSCRSLAGGLPMAERRPTLGDRRHPGPHGSRLQRHLLSVHRHGHAGGQQPAQPLWRHRASRLTPGADASPALRRLARSAPSTRPARAQRRLRPSSAVPHRRISRSMATKSPIAAPTNGASAASSCIAPISARRQAASMPSSWDRRCRGDDAPVERLGLPLRRGAGRSRRRREGGAEPGHQAHLWRELDGAPGLCAA